MGKEHSLCLGIGTLVEWTCQPSNELMTGCKGEQANQLFAVYIHEITPNLFSTKLEISTEEFKLESSAFRRKGQTQPRTLMAKTDRTTETTAWICSGVISLKRGSKKSHLP